MDKLSRNKKRDRIVSSTLRNDGWAVLRIWEHELIPKNESRCVKRIRRVLNAAIEGVAAATPSL